MVMNSIIGVDGISIMFIILTTFITMQIVNERRAKETTMKILMLSSIIIMTFISIDIYVWYICFETILIPMFLIIMSTGYKKKEAAIIFFIYTLMGSLMMLIGIIIIDYTTRNNELHTFI